MFVVRAADKTIVIGLAADSGAPPTQVQGVLGLFAYGKELA